MHSAGPMWRNGRRNGLKTRSREKRGMGSTPIIGTSKIAILLGKLRTIRDVVDCERSRTKTHENTVYLSSIRQVTSLCFFLRAYYSPRNQTCSCSASSGGQSLQTQVTKHG